MSTTELYSKGARVWIPDAEHVWVGAEVKKFEKDELKVELEDGRTQVVKVTSSEQLPPLRNPDILIGENDLTSLSYLHEPAGNIPLVLELVGVSVACLGTHLIRLNWNQLASREK
ncbi:unconventional myosin-Va [Trichonephila clavata]|uniref:Unconventional myosin-Va n=1 Tax=Trichonephila clavata TaxID=2740835 RepID=A0A8X6LZW1_TRICU|nr:unconventional myosin-Va [Trichonephila clavata]